MVFWTTDSSNHSRNTIVQESRFVWNDPVTSRSVAILYAMRGSGHEQVPTDFHQRTAEDSPTIRGVGFVLRIEEANRVGKQVLLDRLR